MKIMFIQPDFPETLAYDSIFPFGYASMGAVLQHAGHEVEYVCPAAKHLSMENVVDYVARSDANLIGIGGLLPYLAAIIKLVRMIKSVRQDIPVVLGGMMATYTPELVLRKAGADFCIAGEGEIPLLKLVNSLENGNDYSTIPGLVFQREGQMINNGVGEVMPFEEIPMPNWKDFPMDYYLYSDWYLPKYSRTRNERVFAWLLSRGCPLKCNFCASGCKARYKKVDRAMTELREIVALFDPDYLLLTDNFLMHNRKYITEFCEGLIANKFRFKFSITGRFDMVDSQLLALMKKAGCQVIFYGLECANNEILKFMKKNIIVQQVISGIELTKKAGLYPMVSIMFGQPGETLEDFLNSLTIALTTTDPKDPVPNVASVMPLLTFPGTGIYKYAMEQGYFTDEEDYWEKYGNTFRINYTKHTEIGVQQAIIMANAMYHWKYHQSMANKLLETVKLQGSFYLTAKHAAKLLLKSPRRLLKILFPNANQQQGRVIHATGMEVVGGIGKSSHYIYECGRGHLRRFAKHCLKSLARAEKE